MLYQNQNEPRKPAPGSDSSGAPQEDDKQGPAMFLGQEDEKPSTEKNQ